MGNHSDRLIVPQARYIATIEDLEDASFVFDRCVGSLIEDAPHMTVTFRGSVAAADSCSLVVSGAGAHSREEVSVGRKGRCRDAHFGNDLLRRICSQTGHLRQPLDLVLMGA